MVMDSDGYLGMPIPTIKHDNLNEYGKILTANHESRRKIHSISYITNSLLIGQKKEGKGQGPRDRQKRIEKCTEKTLL